MCDFNLSSFFYAILFSRETSKTKRMAKKQKNKMKISKEFGIRLRNSVGISYSHSTIHISRACIPFLFFSSPCLDILVTFWNFFHCHCHCHSEKREKCYTCFVFDFHTFFTQFQIFNRLTNA